MNEVVVNLPWDHECDIKLVFPNGISAVLQYRLESPSIDFCFVKEMRITNWQGDDMKPAKHVVGPHGGQHIRMARQLCIEFDPEWLEEK